MRSGLRREGVSARQGAVISYLHEESEGNTKVGVVIVPNGACIKRCLKRSLSFIIYFKLFLSISAHNFEIFSPHKPISVPNKGNRFYI